MVSPSPHNSVPAAVVDRVEVVSQLLVTVITGADGILLGLDEAIPKALVQPLTVVDTL